MSWIPGIRWGGATQGDNIGDWDGFYIRLTVGPFSAEWSFCVLDRRFR